MTIGQANQDLWLPQLEGKKLFQGKTLDQSRVLRVHNTQFTSKL